MPETKKIFASIDIYEPLNTTAQILYEQFMSDEVIDFDEEIEYGDFDCGERIKNYDVFQNEKTIAKYGIPFDIMREYKIYKALESEDCIPKLINIYKSRKRKDKYILVVEHIEGITLLEYVRSISFDKKEFENIINNLLLILHRLYKKYNFCHYDLHADNILITKTNKIILLDFEYTYINNCVKTNHGALYGIYNDRPNPSFDILKLCASLYDIQPFREVVDCFVDKFEFVDNTLIYYVENKLSYKDFYNVLNGYWYCNIV